MIKNKMTIQELIDKLDALGRDMKVSVASDEHLDVVFDEVCVEKVNGKVVLFGLDGSEDF
jgi:hypothetical protein